MVVAAKKYRSANGLGRGQNVDQTDGPGQSAVRTKSVKQTIGMRMNRMMEKNG